MGQINETLMGQINEMLMGQINEMLMAANKWNVNGSK